eukprot:6468123-Amphidinium_carterae.1
MELYPYVSVYPCAGKAARGPALCSKLSLELSQATHAKVHLTTCVSSGEQERAVAAHANN